MEKNPTEKKKKVCQLSSLHFALDTRIFYKYAKSLSTIFEVVVVGVHPKREIIDGVEIIPFKEYKSRSLRLFTSWFFMFFKAIGLKADLYHIHDPELLPCAILLKFFGKKVIIDVHENIAEDIFDKDWVKNKNITFRIFDKVERLACKNIPVVLAEDSYRKRYENFARNLIVIHNYVEPEFFTQFHTTKRNPLHLFYIGIILESRCIIEIMEAMEILHNKGLKVHFHCVGQLFTRIEKLVKSHPSFEKLESFLHFYGRKNLEEGYKISMDCGIGLCLIKPMKNSIESKPTKVFEYMACGLLILTSNFPLYKELVEKTDCGLTTNPESVEEIARGIEKLLESEIKRNVFSANGIVAARSLFNWESEKQKLLKLYADNV